MDNDQYREVFQRAIENRPDLGGRFAELSYRGHGSFSLVFEGRDLPTGEKVAIKIFRPDMLGESYRLECFRREAEVCEKLRGQRDILGWIAPCSEFDLQMSLDHGGSFPLRVPYFAVELASSDVARVIDYRRWSLLETLRAFHCMCRAVQRVHMAHVVHRDLKPSNFLVMADGSLRLSDFGTARELGGEARRLMESYSFPVGDIRYTAPEMLALLHDDDPGTAYRADIFSLGATFYEMLTGLSLGGQLFDQRFVNDLIRAMANVPRGHRRRIFDGFIPAVSAGHPLPSLTVSGTVVPRSVLPLLDSLYMSLAAIDYRHRLDDFERIFLKLRACIFILENDEKYRRWRRTREIYRANRERKRTVRKAIALEASTRDGNGASQ